MIVMPASHRSATFGYLCCKFQGRLASLLSPQGWKEPLEFCDYAIDNGAFTGFKEQAFVALLEKAKRAFKPPMWVVVPDVVGDAAATKRMWNEWSPRLREYGWPLAMAMQDGMTPADFKADIAFIGGSTLWKWRNLKMWMDVPRFHVGRVNTERHLWQSHDAGAESCDGTGWFRDRFDRLPQLVRYLEQSSSNQESSQMKMEGIV